MRKILSLVLAFIFVVSICASAPVTIKANAASVDDLTFELNEDGQSYSVSDCSTSASGEMVIPSTYNGLPVTSIGYRAFGYCTSLTSITIPDSVTSIGEGAFSGCISLTSVCITDIASWCNIDFNRDLNGNTSNPLYYAENLYLNGELVTELTIPESVTEIKDYAFQSCDSLTSITIPDSVTSIGCSAFEDCSSLTSLTIPDSVTSIGDEAFYYCSSLTSITFGDGVTSIDNGTFSGCTSLTSVTIPDSVTSIGDNAFYECTSLTSITIPDSVTSIGDGAFWDCYTLLNITIPDSVTSISSCVFSNCRSLESITIPDSVTGIGMGAFQSCDSLTSITIPDSVTSIGDYAFYNCESLTSITIPDSLISISYCSFYNTAYYNNESNWENGVLYIGNHLINSKKIVSDSYVIKQGTKTIANSAFSYQESLKNIIIPDSVTRIGDCAFYECTSLTSITIPGSLMSIGEEAFHGCSSLTSSIIIPDGVTSIGDDVFSGCTSVTSITIPDSVTGIGDDAFYYCTSLTNITIPDSVTRIGGQAFYDCTSLTSVTIPDSVISIGYNAFCNTAHSNDESNWENGVLYIGNHLMEAKDEISGAYTIKNGTKTIAGGAFYDCVFLTSITIPDSVKSIGEWAFYGCSSLASITIPDSVTSIGDCAFGECTSLTRITISDSVTSIGYKAFEDCSSLKSITIPDSVTSIGDYALGYYWDSENFEYYKIEGFTIYGVKGSEAEIYANENGFAFIDGTNVDPLSYLTFELNEDGQSYSVTGYSEDVLGELVIPDTYNGLPVTSIDNEAFYGCTSLTNITIPDSVTSIGYGAFWGCTSLTSVTIPDSVTSIGWCAFYDCTSLANITIPDSVTSIGGYAFKWCESLTSITIPDSVTSIGSSAFYNTGYYNDNSNWENNVLYIGKHLIESKKEILGAYTIKSGTKTIAGGAFEECSSLTSVTIPDSVTSIGDEAFYSCDLLTSVYITDIASWCNIEFGGSNANPLCNGAGLYLNGELVTDLTIPESVTEIKDYVFYYYTSLTSITIPDSVMSIGESAFYRCTSLTDITIPDSVTSIGVWAFGNCDSLTSITIPDSVTSIGGYAFEGTAYYDDDDNWENGVLYIGNHLINGEKINSDSYVIKQGTITIADRAFWEGYSLKSVVIPESVISIGEIALGYGFDPNGPSWKIEGFTIYGEQGSEAERYANDNGFAFVGSLLISPKILTTESTENGIKFTWSTVDGADGYTVFKLTQDATGNYVYKELATVGASTLAFTDWTAVDGETYCYAVCAMDNYGATSPYAEFAFTYVKPIPLATPTVKVANTAKGIKVTWNKVDNAQKYVVYRRFYSPTNKRWSGWVALKTTTGLSFTDTTTKIGINYRYTVKAVNGSNVSGIKSTSNIKFDVKPTVTVANASNGIKVSWSTVANATGYTVYSSTYNAKTKKWSGWKNRGTTKANAKSWVDKSAKAGTIYKYTVRAVCGSNASSFVASANIVRLLNPTVKAVKASNGIKVTWNKIAGAKNYKIYRAQYVNGKWSGWSGIATTNNKTFAYVDKTAKKGVYYKYTVRAVNGKSASSFTASKNVKR